MMPSRSPYEILGVGANATKEEIRAAYEEKCLHCRPRKADRGKDPWEKLRPLQVLSAYAAAYAEKCVQCRTPTVGASNDYRKSYLTLEVLDAFSAACEVGCHQCRSPKVDPGKETGEKPLEVQSFYEFMHLWLEKQANRELVGPIWYKHASTSNVRATSKEKDDARRSGREIIDRSNTVGRLTVEARARGEIIRRSNIVARLTVEARARADRILDRRPAAWPRPGQAAQHKDHLAATMCKLEADLKRLDRDVRSESEDAWLDRWLVDEMTERADQLFFLNKIDRF
ncbi:hypothetical protein GGR56DRAFT_629674 [Xylariaceae sp. FL0804]|nr:hypothetical protein GGR56DRAFT_629674 [Xylariaceae sp. FL0804]